MLFNSRIIPSQAFLNFTPNGYKFLVTEKSLNWREAPRLVYPRWVHFRLARIRCECCGMNKNVLPNRLGPVTSWLECTVYLGPIPSLRFLPQADLKKGTRALCTLVHPAPAGPPSCIQISVTQNLRHVILIINLSFWDAFNSCSTSVDRGVASKTCDSYGQGQDSFIKGLSFDATYGSGSDFSCFNVLRTNRDQGATRNHHARHASIQIPCFSSLPSSFAPS